MLILRRFAVTVAAVAAVAAMTGLPANAAAKKKVVIDGMAAMHGIVKVGNRICFDEHYHYGSSAGQPTKAAAQKAAVDSWFQLVDLEYGSDWGNFNKSINKKVSCSQSTGGWGCDVESVPCR